MLLKAFLMDSLIRAANLFGNFSLSVLFIVVKTYLYKTYKINMTSIPKNAPEKPNIIIIYYYLLLYIRYFLTLLFAKTFRKTYSAAQKFVLKYI